MPNQDIKLKKFNMNMIKNTEVCVFIGKRNTGKSFCLKDLLYHHQDIPVGTVISSTEEANRFFGDFVPPLFIHGDFDPEILENFIQRQRALKEKKEKDPYRYKEMNPHAFLVFDDLMYAANKWIRDENVTRIFMNGRHYKILFLLTMQYPLGIPPALRTSIDWIFIFRESYVKNRQRLYENYAGMFPSFDVFCQVMDQMTEDFGCLVIHNSARSNKLEDQVFYYKASEHPPFRLCNQRAWEYSYAQLQRESNPYKKNSKISITVRKEPDYNG
jgi:hypothetical protein